LENIAQEETTEYASETLKILEIVNGQSVETKRGPTAKIYHFSTGLELLCKRNKQLFWVD